MRIIEILGHIVFSFTRNVTENYNPESPEFTIEAFGYDPLQSTGLEWNYLPVDELIYQEHDDKEVTSPNYFAACSCACESFSTVCWQFHLLHTFTKDIMSKGPG